MSKYQVNSEIDGVEWLGLDAAARRLTYDYDRATLAEALPYARKSYPVVVLRHAEARSRRAWKGDDRERTLTKVGERQAAVDLDIVVEYGVPIVDLSKAVRDNVTQRIERMTGLEVTEVNVYVDDIFLEEEEKAPAPERVQ